MDRGVAAVLKKVARLRSRLELEVLPSDARWNGLTSMVHCFEHVASCGLVFERLFEIAGALAQLLKEPSVLDRNHRLVGECRGELDLLRRERIGVVAVQGENAEKVLLAQKRNAENEKKKKKTRRSSVVRCRYIPGPSG